MANRKFFVDIDLGGNKILPGSAGRTGHGSGRKGKRTDLLQHHGQ